METTHKAGQLFALSSGCYSDYRFNGLYCALCDIDLGAMATEYASPLPKAYTEGYPTEYGFAAFLIASGKVEEIEYDEVHCGLYEFDYREIETDMAMRRVPSPSNGEGG